MDDYMHGILKFLNGFIIGGVLGLIGGLLFAPSSGEVMQKKIASEVENTFKEVELAGLLKRQELEKELELLRSGNK
jgi:gas vesicle protein